MTEITVGRLDVAYIQQQSLKLSSDFTELANGIIRIKMYFFG